MASTPRCIALRLLSGLLVLGTPAAAQVPLPPAAQVLKPLGEKVLQAIVRPKMKVDHFTVGGFTVTDVDPTSDATAEKFEGTGLLQMPAPGHPTKITFKDLVLKGTAAEGTVEADFPADHHATVQEWLYRLKKAVISDKGSHLVGTASLAGIRVELASVPFTPAGLVGTLAAGHLPLAEGAFEASLLDGKIVFLGATAPRMEGTVEVNLAAPLRHAETGDMPTLTSGVVSFDSRLLVGTGPLVEDFGATLPLLHKGATWRMDTLSLQIERGAPVLRGNTRLQFPLQVFCQASASSQPYLTGSAYCSIFAQAPTLPPGNAPTMMARTKAAVLAKLSPGFPGFSGSFPLQPATLTPSGLTAYRFLVEGGTASVSGSVVQPDSTQVTGRVQWGPTWGGEVSFTNAHASLSDGLYVTGGSMYEHAVKVGGYTIHHALGGKICDFSPSISPDGVEPEWEGVYLPIFGFTLPEELYQLDGSGQLVRLDTTAQHGRFEANGQFSAAMSVTLSDEVMVRIAPAKLDPFTLNFVDGVLLNGPTVTGQFKLELPGVIPHMDGAISFHLTHKGVEQIEVRPQAVADTGLVGVSMAIDKGTLNEDNWDFSGRFDFAVKGADLPSFPFDHFVLQATGGGINGDNSPLKLGVVGGLWEAVPGSPTVGLWGFGYGLAERGFGTQALDDGSSRFYVGFGGNMDINPLLPTFYNRVLFTTQKGNKDIGTIELENGFDLNQDMAGLGLLSAHLDFLVDAKPDGQVDDAYFFGQGTANLATNDTPLKVNAGVRFGHSFPNGAAAYPYFYALGSAEGFPPVPVAPDVEIYSFTGGLSQNFKMGQIDRDPKDGKILVEGTPDAAQGYAILGGAGVGSTDEYTFTSQLDFYVSQNLTAVLHGDGHLFAPRSTARGWLDAHAAGENRVTADLTFTRHPNTLHAAFGADIQQFGGQLRYVGDVVLHFGPDQKYLHIGTKDAPIKAYFLQGMAEGFGYLTADVSGDTFTLGAGGGFSVDTGQRDFGPLWGRAYLNARGDLLIQLDSNKNASIRGAVSAEGGAAFGMEFSTFWHDYDITIFSGTLRTSLVFQAPATPRLSGDVVFHYSVLGGLFEGSVGAHMEF